MKPIFKKVKFTTSILSVIAAQAMVSPVYAQTIKTYNGPLEKPQSMICSINDRRTINATYQYYEDSDGKRIWHGPFRARVNTMLGCYLVNGRYEHGIQSGLWTETEIRKENSQKTSILKYNFESGRLNGAYMFQSLGISINSAFKDNKFSGALYVTDNQGFSIKGQCNEQGLASGEWVIQYKNSSDILHIRKYIFDNGIAMKIIDIDNSTGVKTVLREATKSTYGTIVIDNQHYTALKTNRKDSIGFSELCNNDIDFYAWVDQLRIHFDGLFDFFIEECIPLYDWVGKLTYQPFVGLIHTADPKESQYEDEEPVIIAETMPSFQGGDVNAFARWCSKNIKYPSAAADNGSQGKVTVQFVVERDGSVSNITILRGVDKYLDEEAIRVVQSSPKWQPGANRGKPVRVYIQVPINFVQNTNN